MRSRKAWYLATAALALVLYALLWVGFAQQWNWLIAADESVIARTHHFGVAHTGWVTSWDVFCTVFGPTAFRLITLVVIVIALTRRKLRVALYLLITVEFTGLITEAAKAAAHRPRPEEALTSSPSTSFPSGHALGVLVAVLALLTVVLPVVRPHLRPWLITIGAIIVVAIGVGRVVLNVHHVSDVLAGWALGYAWYVACTLVVPPSAPITAADKIPAAPGNSR
jgi:membrane-associated phospholipid phosphatase